MATTEDRPAEPAPLACARCGAGLWPGAGNFFQVTIEAVADPTSPVLCGRETAEEIRREIERAPGRLSVVSAREALDQVYRRLVRHLCGPCYRTWIEDPARAGLRAGGAIRTER